MNFKLFLNVGIRTLYMQRRQPKAKPVKCKCAITINQQASSPPRWMPTNRNCYEWKICSWVQPSVTIGVDETTNKHLLNFIK